MKRGTLPVAFLLTVRNWRWRGPSHSKPRGRDLPMRRRGSQCCRRASARADRPSKPRGSPRRCQACSYKTMTHRRASSGLFGPRGFILYTLYSGRLFGPRGPDPPAPRPPPPAQCPCTHASNPLPTYPTIPLRSHLPSTAYLSHYRHAPNYHQKANTAWVIDVKWDPAAVATEFRLLKHGSILDRTEALTGASERHRVS